MNLRDRFVLRHKYGEGSRNISAVLKVPMSSVGSIIGKRNKFGKTRTLPRAGWSFKLSNRWRKALVKEVSKNLMVTKSDLHHSSVERGEPSRRHNLCSDLLLVERPDKNHSLTKDKVFLSSIEFETRYDSITRPPVKHGGGRIILWGHFILCVMKLYAKKFTFWDDWQNILLLYAIFKFFEM